MSDERNRKFYLVYMPLEIEVEEEEKERDRGKVGEGRREEKHPNQ